MSAVLSVALSIVLPLGLMAALIPPAVRQLRGPTPPSRLLAEALTAGFVLLVCTLLVSMPWWLQILWWVTLVTVVAAVAVTTWRSLKAADEGSQVQGPPGQPVSRGELVVNGVLWALMIVAALAGG